MLPLRSKLVRFRTLRRLETPSSLTLSHPDTSSELRAETRSTRVVRTSSVRAELRLRSRLLSDLEKPIARSPSDDRLEHCETPRFVRF
eukprot:750386-Hanusia_phi.AAC.7